MLRPMRSAFSFVTCAALCTMPALALAEPKSVEEALKGKSVRVEGEQSVLVLAQPNVSDANPPSEAETAICRLPCTPKLSFEQSYFTLGSDGQKSPSFRVSPFTDTVVVRNGSNALRTGSLLGAGVGAVTLTAGLGFFLVHAIANDDNNPAAATTAGSLGVPLMVGGAITLVASLVLYAVSGTSIHVTDRRSSANSLPVTTALAF